MEEHDGLRDLGCFPRERILEKISTGRRWFKDTAILLLFASWVLGNATGAGASWLIDQKKFHVSAHGQNSCLDCHEDVEGNALHPDPGDVNRNLEDFFAPEQCVACHDGILEEIGEGVHAGNRVGDPREYRSCLRCHDPHEQMRVEGNRMGRFDPSRPPYEQCGACHEERADLPPCTPEDEACVSCHGAGETEDVQGREWMVDFCFHCHGMTGTDAQRLTGEKVPLMKQEDFESTAHAGLGCAACHVGAMRFPHSEQMLGDCGRCHLRHDEKVAHDAHIGVSCAACHLGDVMPERDPESGTVKWAGTTKDGEPSRIHEMVRGKEEGSCRRCHFKENRIGAAAMILPPKSLLCMPCHAATFSIGDTTTVVALVVFLAGMVMVFGYVLTGSMEGRDEEGALIKLLRLPGRGLRSLFSPGIVPIVKVLVLDGIFQRRLYRQSPRRWFIHGLIFWPFLVRFLWGIVALVGSLWRPEWEGLWAMLDKNHPLTAFLFDLTGTMLILGLASAFIRGSAGKAGRPADLPGQDRLALALIAAIVIVGFVLEGARMATAGIPQNAGYAFVGRAVAVMFSGVSGLTGIYGYIWYIHAVLTGIFVAYLPFSRLIHIILGPLVLAVNAAGEAEGGRRAHGRP
ncbi:MAG: hypothetical protein JW821_14220 [Deltaproteobacteria bacterium]|nr:hypothetical protein [Deltaproteobacteria bacterium]